MWQRDFDGGKAWLKDFDATKGFPGEGPPIREGVDLALDPPPSESGSSEPESLPALVESDSDTEGTDTTYTRVPTEGSD